MLMIIIAQDKEIGSYMIIRAIIHHQVQMSHIDVVFKTVSDWAIGKLPGIVDRLKIPQTESKPGPDTNFDFFGFFDCE